MSILEKFKKIREKSDEMAIEAETQQMDEKIPIHSQYNTCLLKRFQVEKKCKKRLKFGIMNIHVRLTIITWVTS